MRNRLSIPILLALFLMAGYALERSSRFAAMRQALRGRAVPTAMANRGPMGQLLRALGLVVPVRNDRSVYPESVFPRVGFWASSFQKKSLVGQYLYEANPNWLAETGTRRLPPPQALPANLHREGWPLLSLEIHPAELNDPRWGIVHNWRGRGLEWERVARATYFEHGQERFSTLLGIRLHGGQSRLPGNRHSFRLYFREPYGLDRFPPECWAGPDLGPVRRVVLKADWPDTSPFANALAFDVAEHLGGVLPARAPVQLVINGEPLGRYFLTEHLSPDPWSLHVGHKDFLMFVHKGGRDAESLRELGRLHDAIRAAPEPLTIRDVADQLDLQNVSRFILALAYCGTSDGFQGAAILDQRQPHPRWSWISWDMDHSFWDPYGRESGRDPWQTGSWERTFVARQDPAYPKWLASADIRALAFGRLIQECPEYRRWFLRFTMDALNHRLTPRFLDARVDVYERLSVADGIQDLGFIANYRQFVRRRPGLLREGLRTHFGAPEFLPCSVEGPNGFGLLVDGHPESTGYQGEYLRGETLTVALADEAQASEFSHWEVNGQVVSGPSLSTTVDAPLHITVRSR